MRSLNWNTVFEKIKWLLVKLRSLWHVHFVLPILFVLTLASDKSVLYESDAFSILALSTKKWHSRFLRRVFVFQKIYVTVKVLKTFRISNDCHIKTCWSLKRRAINIIKGQKQLNKFLYWIEKNAVFFVSIVKRNSGMG